jgi:hypothetical protein
MCILLLGKSILCSLIFHFECSWTVQVLRRERMTHVASAAFSVTDLKLVGKRA